MSDNSFDRKTAVKIKIADLCSGEFVKSSGDFNPSYVNINNEAVGRVNLMGIVVDMSELKDSFSLDDSTGIIEIRSFNNDQDLKLALGDAVNVIGKPREFNSELFIVYEVVRKISPKWLELRKKELSITKLKEHEIVEESKPEVAESVKEVVEEEIKESNTCDNEQSPLVKVLGCVKELDEGHGADFDEVVETSKLDGAEEIINRLLEEGELFEVKSGRLKVLE